MCLRYLALFMVVLVGLCMAGAWAKDEAMSEEQLVADLMQARTEAELDAAATKIIESRNDVLVSLRSHLVRDPSKEHAVRLAWLLGEMRSVAAVPDLAARIDLEAKLPPGELTEPLRWGKYPAREALVEIGRAVVPFMIENLATSDDEEVRRLSAETIVSVIGRYADVDAATAREWATQRLEQAVAEENDDPRRQKLKDALNLLEDERRK